MISNHPEGTTKSGETDPSATCTTTHMGTIAGITEETPVIATERHPEEKMLLATSAETTKMTDRTPNTPVNVR